jgi:uncharacterized Zn finger protein (UPF0148 family)
MYKYKCSKDECSSSWITDKGTLNGFILTCPICGKGRGVFMSQSSETRRVKLEEQAELMVITVNKQKISSIDELNKKIEEYAKNIKIDIVNKEINSMKDTIEVRIEYIRCKE